MSERLDNLLANMSFAPARGNLIFAVDATASRQSTWDQAAHLTAQMFREVATTGVLSMQVGYFRGDDECRFSGWKDDPMALVSMMTSVMCASGMTQIRKVLEHAKRESAKLKIAAMIYIGDCCEAEGGDTRDVIAGLAAQVGMPVFVFQEGDDSVAGEVFAELARISGGKRFAFQPDCLSQLAEVLAAIAKFSVGGNKALSAPELKLLGRS